MRIAICDDNDIDREIAREMLERGFGALGMSPEIGVYSDGVVLIDDIRDGDWYDIIFLDIFMEKMLGIDVAHRLRELGYDGEIVFLTASADFAIPGYDVSAAGYIVKPIDENKLRELLKRVTRTISESTYAIRKRSVMIRVPLGEIMYVESSNSKCILHRSDGNCFNIYKKLDEIEAELKDRRFLRCSQSYIVNMDHVVKIDKSFELKNGEIVLIRQKSLKAIQEAYAEYINSAGGGQD